MTHLSIHIILHVNLLPVVRVYIILQCCFCIARQSREELPHYVLVLYLLVGLELIETRVEVIQENQQGG